MAVSGLSFGNRLKFLRTEHNLTQSKLAEKITLSKANVSKYESDLLEPNLHTIAAIASLFNVSADYLLGLSDKYPISENMQTLTDLISDLNEEELKKVIEYVEFLKSKRNLK